MNYSYNPETCDSQGKCYGQMPTCPEFIIKQHDTRPAFKVDITECDLPVDLSDLVTEVSMWTNAKLKINIDSSTNTISFADNIGFEQINYDTIIQIGNGRLFERMLVKQINDLDNTVTVLRGQANTGAYKWKKGTTIKLIRFLNNPAVGEMLYQDIEQIDGTVTKNQLVRSTLLYEWLAGDTCMCGKYFLEFKVLKMNASSNQVVTTVDGTSSITYVTTPSQNNGSNNLVNYHCEIGENVEWVRRYPNDKEGFLIQIIGTPTAE